MEGLFNTVYLFYKGDFHAIPVFIYRIAFRQRMVHE